jgi:hypothetical protein
MVASIGYGKNTSQNPNHYLEEWTPVTKNSFIKKGKKLGTRKIGNFKIPNHFQKMNRNTIHVLIGSVEFTNKMRQRESVPHKPLKVEVLRKKKNIEQAWNQLQYHCSMYLIFIINLLE